MTLHSLTAIAYLDPALLFFGPKTRVFQKRFGQKRFGNRSTGTATAALFVMTVLPTKVTARIVTDTDGSANGLLASPSNRGRS